MDLVVPVVASVCAKSALSGMHQQLLKDVNDTIIHVRLPLCEIEVDTNGTDSQVIMWNLLSDTCQYYLIGCLVGACVLFVMGLVTSILMAVSSWTTQPRKIRGPGRMLSYEAKRLRKYLTSLWVSLLLGLVPPLMFHLCFCSSCSCLKLCFKQVLPSCERW